MKPQVGVMSFAHPHAFSYANALRAGDRAEFAGVCDENTERGQTQAERYGVEFFADFDEMLQHVDAVTICTENAKHAKYAIRAANAGKHSISEKPLMTRLDDGQRMLEAARTNGTKLFTAFPCRFSPSFLRLKAMVEKGDLGSIFAVRATNRGMNPGDWFVQPELSGGGAMIDHTVHVADLLRLMLGVEVASVYAEVGNNIYHEAWEDTAMLTLEFENGIFATLDSSWSRPRRSYPTWGDVTMGVVGDGGVAEMDMFGQVLLHYSEDSGKYNHVGWGTNTDALMIDAFLDQLNGEDTSYARLLATGEDGFRAAEVALAAYESTRQLEPVKLR